ncbi:MAG: putative basic amino acid antiporter YfcC, partial [Cloacibacillus sp.]
MSQQQNKARWVPDTYIIIFFVVLFAALLTWTVPVGQFETKEIKYTIGASEKTRNVLVPESFKYKLDDNGQPVKQGIKIFEPYGETGVLNYTFEGFCSGDKWGSAVGVMAFILIVGGAFGIILRTKAVETGIKKMISKSKGMDKLIIPILFVLFSLGGAVFGMGEEAIPFVFIVVPVVISLGYDSIVAVMITYVATQIGFATSWMNPFSVAIAQGISQIPVMSAAGFRMFMWVFFTLLGTAYTWRYAMKIRKDPKLSPVYEADAFFRNDIKETELSDETFSTGDMLVILTIVAGMVWIIWGVVEKGYYIPEIATQFFIMGLVAGFIGVIFKLDGMKVNDIASSFRSGAADLL